MGSATGVKDALELRPAADAPCGWQSIRQTALPRSCDGEALPPLGAPARKHLPALLGRHADEKPVGPLAMPAVRLKCAYALGHDC